MKLRLSRSGLRLRLTVEDISALRLGQPISVSTQFPNGLFVCRLTAVPEEVGAVLTDHGIVVTIPAATLGDLEAGRPVSAGLQTPSEALDVLIEKDRRSDHP